MNVVQPQPRSVIATVAGPAPVSSPVPVYLAVILGYILLLPPQFNVSIGGSVLPPYRFFLIPAALYVLGTGLRGRFTMTWPDYLMIGATAWVCLAIFMTTEAVEAFTTAVAQSVDIGLAYFFARAVFQKPRDLRLFLLLMVPGLAVMGALLVFEAVTKQHVLQPFFARLTGKSFYVPIDMRMGLMRAQGSFPHPILAGIFMASFLPLFWLSGLRGWPRFVGVIAAFASFFTFSSAAMLALTAGTALVAYNWLSERIANLTWRLFFVGVGVLTFATELGTNSGMFNLMMRYAALNAGSAYNRVLIWRYGTENVRKNPWFGLGYGDWERPSWMVGSLDHYWLLLAMQFGVMAPILIALAMIIALVVLARETQYGNLADRRTKRGLAIAMGVFALGVISVSVWLSAQIWFFAMLGMTVGIGSYAARRREMMSEVLRRQQYAAMRALRQQPQITPGLPGAGLA